MAENVSKGRKAEKESGGSRLQTLGCCRSGVGWVMWRVREVLSQREEEEVPRVHHCLGDDICSRSLLLGDMENQPRSIRLTFMFSLLLLLDLVLGAEGSEESEPGAGGPAPGGHRLCWEGGPVSPHPELQEKPQLQHFGQVVRSGECLLLPMSPQPKPRSSGAQTMAPSPLPQFPHSNRRYELHPSW